jgi:hypothetical protein
VGEGRQSDPHVADRLGGKRAGLALKAVRLVVGAQPGQIGTDLLTGDLGDVPVARVLNPLGQTVKIGVDGAGA